MYFRFLLLVFLFSLHFFLVSSEYGLKFVCASQIMVERLHFSKYHFNAISEAISEKWSRMLIDIDFIWYQRVGCHSTSSSAFRFFFKYIIVLRWHNSSLECPFRGLRKMQKKNLWDVILLIKWPWVSIFNSLTQKTLTLQMIVREPTPVNDQVMIVVPMRNGNGLTWRS